MKDDLAAKMLLGGQDCDSCTFSVRKRKSPGRYYCIINMNNDIQTCSEWEENDPTRRFIDKIRSHSKSGKITESIKNIK